MAVGQGPQANLALGHRLPLRAIGVDVQNALGGNVGERLARHGLYNIYRRGKVQDSHLAAW
jgi:hypothetical protein